MQSSLWKSFGWSFEHLCRHSAGEGGNRNSQTGAAEQQTLRDRFLSRRRRRKTFFFPPSSSFSFGSLSAGRSLVRSVGNTPAALFDEDRHKLPERARERERERESAGLEMARMLMEMTTLFGYIDTVWKSTRVLASLHWLNTTHNNIRVQCTNNAMYAIKRRRRNEAI